MKLYHLALLFVVFLLGAIIHTDISIGKMKVIETEQARLSKMLNSATSDAINYLTSTEAYGAGNIHKNEVVETFFYSIYSSMGIMSNPIAQRELDLYIPVILLCDSDGYYLYYYDDYKDSDGNMTVERMWSEKKPYYYEDELFIYRLTLTDGICLFDKYGILGEPRRIVDINLIDLRESDDYLLFRQKYSDHFLLNQETYEYRRKEILLEQLEEVLTYYVNEHNFIASSRGISYKFAFPTTSKEWAQYLDDVNLVVVFQGYPYANSMDDTFNKVDSASANILRRPHYYVEQKSWYKLAHHKDCVLLNHNPNVLAETFDSVEAYVKIGAYSCECIEYGSRVPELKVMD